MSKKKKIMQLWLMICICFSFLSGCGDKQASEKSTIATIDDIAGAKIGVQLGTTGDIFASDYEGDENGTEVIRYTKGADAVQALKQNKIDCVIIDEQPALAFCNKNPELQILEEEFAVEDYALVISKENPELLEQVNAALDEIKKDGTLQAIIENYIGDETKGKSPYQKDETLSRENGTLHVASNLEFPPYEYYENGVGVGIDIDLMQAIADRLNMELVVTDMQFDSIIVSVQSGKADIGASGFTITEERKKNINFSDTYTTSKQVVIVNSGSGAESLSFAEKFEQVFLYNNQWTYIPKGLLNTILITFFSGIIGVVLGVIVSNVRVAYERNDQKNKLIVFLNAVFKLYITVFRGTPMMVQLLITYYVIFAHSNISPLLVAVIAFGLNSGAYVSEAIRSGITAIDLGQFEAGRSLGLTYGQTIRYVILPQAIKVSLPAIFNEFIALLKESSIVGYIGLMDLTKAGDILRSNTYEAFLPLIAVALLYLIIVIIMTALVSKLERKLKKDARL